MLRGRNMSHGDDDLRRRAERIADAKLAFRSHVAAYVLVNSFLAVLDLLTSPGELWFFWPLLGWGVGLAAHAFATHGGGADLRDRAVDAEMRRLRNRQS
jgi:hypothetical protein